MKNVTERNNKLAQEINNNMFAQLQKLFSELALELLGSDAQRTEKQDAGKREAASQGSGNQGSNNQGTFDYKIKRGDTLSELAEKYGTSVDALAKLNNIKDPDFILAGATLKIPGGSNGQGNANAASAIGGQSNNSASARPYDLQNTSSNYSRSQLGTGSGSATTAADLLKDFEGFYSKAYWDVNAFRVGYGSDTVTRADGRIERVTQNTTVNKEDAERDLARRVREFENVARKQVGDEAWNGLPSQTRAALTSVAYNYGSLPSGVSAAAKSGNTDAIASAVQGLAGDDNGINARRRGKEADLIRNSQQSSPDAVASNDPKTTRYNGVDEKPKFNFNAGINLTGVTGRINDLDAEIRSKTGQGLTVTSGYRDPYRQARAMYNNYANGTPPPYGNRQAEDEIKSAYNSGRAQGLGSDQTIARMEAVLKRQVAQGTYISDHLKMGAIDVANNPAVLGALRSSGLVDSVLVESNHYHVELKN
jgi:LysM repeat protein